MAEFIHAQWWQPAEPAKKLPGVLFQDENQARMLHLDGSFDEISSAASGEQPMPVSLQDSFPILLGLTSTHQFITAFGCETQRGYLPRGSLDLRPTVLAHGVHFDDESDFTLVSLAVRFSNLDTWADTSRFIIGRPNARKTSTSGL